MHLWGGALVVLGVYAICSLKHIPLKPTTFLVFSTLFLLMVGWEIFEWQAGLFEPGFHMTETAKDIIVGFVGGLLGYVAAIKIRM